MAVFGVPGDKRTPTHNKTILAGGSQLSGELTSDHNLMLDGDFDGTIMAHGDVAIGKSGNVTGDIKALRVLVSGQFEGKIHSNSLEILAGGLVKGEIMVDSLVIDQGGRFVGQSREAGELEFVKVDPMVLENQAEVVSETPKKGKSKA